MIITLIMSMLGQGREKIFILQYLPILSYFLGNNFFVRKKKNQTKTKANSGKKPILLRFSLGEVIYK